MATLYSKYKLTITDDYTFDGTLKYMNPNSLLVSGFIRTSAGGDGGLFTNHEPVYDYQTTAIPDPPMMRRAGWIQIDDSVEQAEVYLVTSATRDGVEYFPRLRVNTQYGSDYIIGDSFGSLYGRYPVTQCEVSTNIPIFETQAEAETYILTGENFEDAINYEEQQLPDPDDTKTHYIQNVYVHGEANYSGITPDSNPYTLNEMFVIEGDACLYRQDDGSLRIVTDGDIVKCQFGNTTAGFDVEQPHLIYQYPFYDYWNQRYIGEGYFAQFLDTSMNIMGTEEEAEEYLSKETDEEKSAYARTHSENYDVLQNAGYNTPNNPMGVGEDSTTFGEVYHKKAFSRQYACTQGALSEIKNGIYDTTAGGIWEDIKKGLDMFGDNPIEAVVDLSYYPFNVDQVISVGAAQNYVFFGGYQLQLNSNSVKEIIFANGYINLGSFNFTPTFNSWRDYPPYTKLYFYCPYCGTHELDVSRYIGKNIVVRFYVDFDTRACMCVLIANGLMCDQFTGSIGVGQPMRGTDFSQFAGDMINTIVGGGAKIAGGAASIATGGVGGALMGAGMSAVGSAIGGGLDVASGMGGTMLQTNAHNINKYDKSVGSATSTLNEFLPQYPYFIIQIDDIKEPDNMQQLIGRPSNKSGTVSQFSGFLKCSKVNLVCQGATENEKREIEQALYNGIYL